MTPLQQAIQQAIHILESADPLPCGIEAANALQKALDAELQQSVEPVLWITDLDDPIICKTEFETATFCEDGQCPIPVYLHPPQHTRPVKPVTANDDDVICPSCCHQFRAIPVGVQQLMLDAGFEPPFKHPPQQATVKQYLKVGDSRFESWYSELNQAGKGSKQIVREAYEAGLNEADAQQAKQVPMTTAQIEDEWYSASSDPAFNDFTNGVRLAEKYHGIGGQP